LDNAVEVIASQHQVGSRTSDELVRTAVAAKLVVPGTAVELVSVAIAGEPVVAASSLEVLHIGMDVVALSRGTAVVRDIVERDVVVEAAEGHGVDAVAAVEVVGAEAVDERVVARPTVEDVPVDQRRGVVFHLVATAFAKERVGALTRRA
jgi:hypothetical protein